MEQNDFTPEDEELAEDTLDAATGTAILMIILVLLVAVFNYK
jgi:hypothetical protein